MVFVKVWIWNVPIGWYVKAWPHANGIILGGGRNLRIWDFVERSETLAYFWSFYLFLVPSLLFGSCPPEPPIMYIQGHDILLKYMGPNSQGLNCGGAKWNVPLSKCSHRYFGHNSTDVTNIVIILLALWWIWRTVDGEWRLSVLDIIIEPCSEAALAPREAVHGISQVYNHFQIWRPDWCWSPF